MIDFSFSSLRVRLLLLVLLALIPAFGLIGYTAWEQRQSAASQAKEKSLKVARNAVEEQEQLITDARQILGALAREPEVMLADRTACPSFLAEQLKQHRIYRNLGVIGLDGALRCSAAPFEGAIDLRDRIYFQQAVATRDFSVGDYQIGRVTGKATIAFGYPVYDLGKNLRGVVFAALDLEWLNRVFSQSHLAPGSSLIVVDQKGTILAHSTDPERWIGKSLPEVPIVRVILTEQREGAAEAAGLDGVERLYAFTILPVQGNGRAFIGVGIPTEAAYAEARHSLLRNVLGLGLVAALALVAAWFGGDLFVVRQVNTLLDATKRFASGDLYGRTKLMYATGELAQLAQSFDAMGVALHAREAELRSSKAEVQNHLERIRALHEINIAINSILDLRGVADVLLEKVDRFFAYPTVAILDLVNKSTGELEPWACRNFDEARWKMEQERSSRDPASVVARTRSPWVVEEIESDPRTKDITFFRRNGLVCYLGIPLMANGEPVGVLSIYAKEKRRFGADEIDFLLALGGQAAITINNSRTYEETRIRAVESDTANHLKSEFLSVMSHELRTPLAVAMGYAGMIKERVLGDINSQQEEALDKVLRRGHDQLYMINSILYAASLQADAVKVDRNDVNLSDVLNDLKSTYAVILEKPLALVWDYPSDLPTLRTDGRKLRHILENLINNAVKFTPSGSVTISARWISGAVRFQVADTGVGIARDLLPSVFEIFRQADGSETRRHGGVGLGLYIVKKFTELLGGKIQVESALGKGSTFIVTMPCAESEAVRTHPKAHQADTRAA
jgi:signal transduction histidine kinase